MSSSVAALSSDEFDESLTSEGTAENLKMLTNIDGFLTAVAIGPELILPSEWVGALLDDDGADGLSAEETRFVLAGLFGWYNAIVDTLVDEPEAFTPRIHGDPRTGETFAEEWVEGFLAGVRLRPDSWRPLYNAENRAFFVPIAAYLRDEDGHYALTPEMDPDFATLRAEAADYIPGAVVAMYQFFKRTRGFFQGASKLGRNDKCFCGSGKKFKRCCGAGR